MKKFGKMRVIIPFLCAVLFVWSCSQKDVSTQESTIGRIGVSDLFFQNLEIAKVHSSGLEFVYERISKMPRSGFRSVDVRIFEAYADSLLRYTHEYAVLSSSLGVELIEKEGDELLNLVETRRAEDGAVPYLRGGNLYVKPLPIEVDRFLLDVEKHAIQGVQREVLATKVLAELNTEIVRSYPKEMQELLSIVGAVYVDSYIYWDANLEKWHALFYDKEPQLRGFFPSWDELKRGMRRVAGDDASSAAQSAILAGFMAATGVGAPGAGAAICASAVVGSAWGATARALGI